MQYPCLNGVSIVRTHYFGDFSRFAAISVEIRDNVYKRVRPQLGAPDGMFDYVGISEFALSIDVIVVAEVENWQAVLAESISPLSCYLAATKPEPTCAEVANH